MQKRSILWWHLLFLLLCNTFVTLNINIAIVSMVNNYDSADKTDETNVICPNTTLFLRDFVKESEQKSINIQKIGYDWSEAEQNTVLSGYYWLNYFSILPGGVLAHKFGSKRVVGYAQAISSMMSSLIPIFADQGPLTVSWIRAIQGLLSFMSVPAGIFTILGNWSPPDERGWFGATFLIGSSMGMGFGSFIFGYIAQYLHWKYVFHLTSVCGLIWTTFWFTLIHDSPRQHPKISFEEREYIEESLKNSSIKTKASIPWKSIVTSIPVLVSLLATNSGIWLFVMLATYSPIYLKTVYGLNSNEIGIVTSIPQFLAGIVALCIGYYSDLAIKKEQLSMTNIRKLCTFTGGIVAVIPLIVIAYTKCNVTVAITGLLICSILKSIATFGSPLVIVDISPKFCGILEGFSGTSSSIQTFVFSTSINYYTGIWSTEELWKTVFLFTASYVTVAVMVYLIFGTSNVQKWNFEDETAPMRKKKSNKIDIEEKNPIYKPQEFNSIHSK